MVQWRALARGPVLTAPGPRGGHMLRDFGSIRRDPLQYLAGVWRMHGDVVQFPVPVPPSYLVSSPEAVRQILVTRARDYGKRTLQYSALSLVTGDGLLTADTATWRPHRRILQPAFHHTAVSLVGDHVAAAADRLTEQWRRQAGTVVDVDAAMMHTALDVVGGALFGTNLHDDAERLAEATLQALDMVIVRARTPISAPSWVPTPGNVRLNRAVRQLDAAVDQMLAARRGPIPETARDMLDLLLAAHGDDVDHLSTRQIRDEIVTFIVAGHETVASALTWAWHLLAQHPDALARLHAEVDALEHDPTVADLDRLPWSRAVFDEALRLYPPAWLITRHSEQPDVLAGREIPAGALLIMSPWIVHRHPSLWRDPERFDPQRFLSGDEQDIQAIRQGYIPFGAGPRLCIGRDMALLEGTLLLAHLARRFVITPTAAPVIAEPLVTIRPRHGLPAVISLR